MANPPLDAAAPSGPGGATRAPEPSRPSGWRSAVEAMGMPVPPSMNIRRNPEREEERDCCVCYNVARTLDHRCPECGHVVCQDCLVKLRKSECPYCRSENPSMRAGVVAHKALNEAKGLMEGAKAIGTAWSRDLQHVATKLEAIPTQCVGAGVAPQVEPPRHPASPRARPGGDAPEAPEAGPDVPLSPESLARSAPGWIQQSAASTMSRAPPTHCTSCDRGSQAWDHTCPRCRVVTCLQCVARLPRLECPACGEVQANASSMQMALQAAATYNIGKASLSAFWGEVSAFTSGIVDHVTSLPSGSFLAPRPKPQPQAQAQPGSRSGRPGRADAPRQKQPGGRKSRESARRPSKDLADPQEAALQRIRDELSQPDDSLMRTQVLPTADSFCIYR